MAIDPTGRRHRGTRDGAAGGGVAAVRRPVLGRAGAGAAGAVGGGVAARHVAPGLRPPPVSDGAGVERSGAGRCAELTPVSRRPEAAAVLRRLCRRAPAGKEPAAARFYREEGNRLFGRRHYGTAVRLYSQVGEAGGRPGASVGGLLGKGRRGSRSPRSGGPVEGSCPPPPEAAALWSPQAASHEPPGSPEVSVCFANRSAALFHLRCFEVSGGGTRGSPVSSCPRQASGCPRASLRTQRVA